MSIKRVEFPNAPTGNIDIHQRSMIAVGLDETTPPKYIQLNGNNSNILINVIDNGIVVNPS